MGKLLIVATGRHQRPDAPSPRRGGAHGGDVGFYFRSLTGLTPVVRAARTFQVLLVDDDPAIRFMLHFTLDSHPDLRVVAEATNGMDAVSLVERIRPDAVIVGVQMPFMDGLTAAKIMKRVSPETRIVMFSAVTARPLVEKAFEMGADLYLSKTTPPSDLVNAVVRLCVEPSGSWSHSA